MFKRLSRILLVCVEWVIYISISATIIYLCGDSVVLVFLVPLLVFPLLFDLANFLSKRGRI